MAESILTVHDSFVVPRVDGDSGILHIARPSCPGGVNGSLPYDLAERIAPRLQSDHPVGTHELAAHMASDSGYRVAVMSDEPSEPLGFAFLRELPPRDRQRPPLVQREGSTGQPRDIVLEQFDVIWRPGVRDRVEAREAVVPPRYLRAADALLFSIVRGMDRLTNLYVTDHPGDDRSPDYFQEAGFRPVDQGVRRVFSRNGWGSGSELLGARAGWVLHTLQSKSDLPRHIRLPGVHNQQ